MALHKVLILIRYDAREFEYYLDAYLEKGMRYIESYRMNEVYDFLKKIKLCMTDYKDGDRVDLYLAQTEQRECWAFQGDFEAAGLCLAEQTEWTDEKAYQVLKKLLGYQGTEIILNGKNQIVGSPSDGCMNVYYKYCAPINRTGTSDYEQSDAMKTSDAVAAGEQPSLAVLMRQLAEGRKA